ncbi:MAG TPA: type I-E CRISPR-associated protein Cas5/CasD [Polyangia bacterium]|jgi:CRISPR system Cascade subunit CasD
MLEVLWLRFDAPLVSFGGAAVDNFGVVQDYPGLSLLTGLIANALGYAHADADRLATLQARLRYAVRCDRPGVRLRDYQTVDLGQDFLTDTGWTTRGARQDRRGGPASDMTHQRYRDYQADSVHTVALTLTAGEAPSLDQIEAALRAPERPLFIGRKCCLPSAPLVLGRTQAATLREALVKAPLLPPARRPEGRAVRAFWPAEEGGTPSRIIATTDERDWRNQVVCGRRLLREGLLTLEVGDA